MQYRDDYQPQLRRMKRGETIYIAPKRADLQRLQNIVSAQAGYLFGTGGKHFRTRKTAGVLEVKRKR